jgi:hypothetical protein
VNLKEIIRKKLQRYGLDKNEAVIGSIEQRVTPMIEERAEKIVTSRVIKKCFAELVDKADKTDEKPPATN